MGFWRTYTTNPHLRWVISGSRACELLFSGTTDGNLAINALISSFCLWSLTDVLNVLKICNNAGLCALSQRVGNETSCSDKPSRQLRDQRGHGPEETASMRRYIPDVEWFHFPLALGCIFSPPHKNWKSTANMFNVSHANIKMGKRACILSFILHKPFAWIRTEKNRHENWVEWFWNISKWREKERSFSAPGQAGSFGLIKTNRMRAGGPEALGKDFNPAVARHTDISNPSAFLKQST